MRLPRRPRHHRRTPARRCRSACPAICIPIFLNLWDLQYRDSKYGYSGESEHQLVNRGSEELREALQSLPASTWVVPVGIHHPDHKLCRRMALRLFTKQAHATWLMYEELAYYHLSRTRRWSARIAVSSALATTGSFATRHVLSQTELATETKISAMQCYTSQMRRLSSDFVRITSNGPESYLRISTPWAGTGGAPTRVTDPCNHSFEIHSERTEPDRTRSDTSGACLPL